LDVGIEYSIPEYWSNAKCI